MGWISEFEGDSMDVAVEEVGRGDGVCVRYGELLDGVLMGDFVV